ncbi:MAG: hypothetical protein SGILL_006574 [Bacillariaceae sp.]
MYAWIEKKDSPSRDQPLYKQIRRLVWFRVAELATYFIGLNALGVFVAQIADRRNYFAWRRREVSKHMIKELQINDDKLDQYEFMVASLLLLNKIEQSDVDQIMDKFRELAGDKQYVCVEEEEEEVMDTALEANDGLGAPNVPIAGLLRV